MIVVDERNPTAVRLAAELDARLPGGVAGDDLVVVIGGDGFLLRTVARLGHDPVYLGLNAGHLGFLLNDVDDWDAVVAALDDGELRVTAFPLLRAAATLADGSVVTDQAINDVYLERGSAQTAHLRLSIDGYTVVEHLVADGMIFSTALGSTAYTFSAGGPACHPTLSMVLVTPICPHSPRLGSFAVPSSMRAEVEVIHPERRPVNAVADGRSVGGVTHVELSIGPDEVRLAHFGDHDFTSRMVQKVLAH